MVRSMTGFGRAQDVIDGISVTVEIKSVNHRYFEFSSRVPRSYGFLDEKLKNFVQSLVARGKIECYVQIAELEDAECVVEINHSLAAGYVKALRELAEKYELRNDISVATVSRYSDIFTVTKVDTDEEKIWNSVMPVAQRAVDAFIAMREREGEKLKNDLLSRSQTILEQVAFVEERSPQTVAEHNAKLVARMQELLGDVHIDEQRLLTEAAIFADKIAVAEETVRLRSHIAQLHEMLESKQAVGRKMDFLIQEINREANTIGSKAQDVDIAKAVIAIKAEVEKIREQVQNIE